MIPRIGGMNKYGFIRYRSSDLSGNFGFLEEKVLFVYLKRNNSIVPMANSSRTGILASGPTVGTSIQRNQLLFVISFDGDH